MLANDIKKGMKLKLKGSGWNATMADNKKGVIRLCDVEGIHRELGSVYVFNIAEVLNPATGKWEPVELTAAQLKQKQNINAFGF